MLFLNWNAIGKIKVLFCFKQIFSLFIYLNVKILTLFIIIFILQKVKIINRIFQ